MINLVKHLTHKTITVALSGGIDSMVLADFLGIKHNIECAFFNHGNEFDAEAEKFVKSVCKQNNWKLTVGSLTRERNNTESLEEFWRNERYKFLDQFSHVVTGHTLDDSVETYIHSALHGQPKVIPYTRANIERPFLLTKKTDIVKWATKRNLRWFEDESNSQIVHTRNFIRHVLLPNALKVNPGLHKVVKRIIETKLIKEGVIKKL